MAGKKCPKCNKPNFFTNSTGGRCSNCGYTMIVPPNESKGGKGQRCLNCGKYTVFNDKCSNCGAKYKTK
jgi:rRNA maturation protein Nop10